MQQLEKLPIDQRKSKLALEIQLSAVQDRIGAGERRSKATEEANKKAIGRNADLESDLFPRARCRSILHWMESFHAAKLSYAIYSFFCTNTKCF